jgi:Transposase DDE domain group 1
MQESDQNRIWPAIVALACEITAWIRLPAFIDQPARRWETKRLRLRLLSQPAQLARHARQVCSTYPRAAPFGLDSGTGRFVRAAEIRRPESGALS